MPRWNKGQSSTPDNPGDSKLMAWISDHLAYQLDYCLIWPFGRNSTGYGIIGRNGKMLYVHRYICTLVHGAPPTPNHQAAHSCGRGEDGCVNPRHLSWKTPSENQLDRLHTGKPFSGRRQKLTPVEVAIIRASDLTDKALADAYGTSDANIRHIRSGRTHRVPISAS